jgi:hypothetical protein
MQSHPVVGFHGSDLPGTVSILRSGGLRNGWWGLCWFLGSGDWVHSGDIRALWDTASRSSKNRIGCMFEIAVPRPFEKLTSGGHEDEREVAQRLGCCHYRSGSRNRWSAVEEATSVVALWAKSTMNLQAELEAYDPFSVHDAA